MAWQDPHGDSDWRDAYGQYGQGQQGPQGQDPNAPQWGPDPYGQSQYPQDPYGQNPYAQAPYPQDPYAQYSYGGYGPAAVPRSGNNGATIAALVANIVCAVLCCSGIAWIPGVITSAIAMGRNNTDPESARRLTIAAWVCFAANIVLSVGIIVLIYAVGGFSSSST
jgi:hypothetical protein